MPFSNLLFYTQCCDVNQPLHPLMRAIPTLGEASGSGPGHWFLFQRFPGSWLGQGSSWMQQAPTVGGVLLRHPALLCPALPCSALPVSCGSHHRPCQHLDLCILRLCTQFFKTQPLKFFPCETSQADPRETLVPNFQSPQSPPGHGSRRGHWECHTPLPNSCLYKVPVSLP